MKVLRLIGIIIGIIIGLFILESAIVTFSPGFSVSKQPLVKTKQEAEEIEVEIPKSRKDVTFQVEGTSISAWLYLPANLSTPVPCIVMGNGFGGTKDMLLENYAIRYQEAGFAVLAFDYRYFGESEGEPRQLLLIQSQLEDYAAAIEYVRSLGEIDTSRIALWGTSASGGYGISIAEKDKDIACVVAQCPGLDDEASEEMFMKRVGIKHILLLLFHGQRDMMRSLFGLSPHKIPIVGKPGSFAFLNTRDAYDGYRKLVPEGFINEVCARVILQTEGYKPSKLIRNVSCPVLIQICEYDSLAPIKDETRKELSKYSEVKSYPIGHFDIYSGSNFEKSVSDQLDFFRKYL